MLGITKNTKTTKVNIKDLRLGTYVVYTLGVLDDKHEMVQKVVKIVREYTEYTPHKEHFVVYFENGLDLVYDLDEMVKIIYEDDRLDDIIIY